MGGKIWLTQDKKDRTKAIGSFPSKKKCWVREKLEEENDQENELAQLLKEIDAEEIEDAEWEMPEKTFPLSEEYPQKMV